MVASSTVPEWLGDMILSHLETLYNFARREIAAALATRDLMPGELNVEDIVDAVVVRALSEPHLRPATLNVDRWLLKLGLEYLYAEVARLKKERASIVYLEEDVPEITPQEAVVTQGDEIFEFYQPDEDLRLEDLLPDPYVPTPEQVNESRDLQRYVNRTLATLPRVWRRAFVLRYVRGLSISEVAAVLGEPEDRVMEILDHVREFLCQMVEETGLQVPA